LRIVFEISGEKCWILFRFITRVPKISEEEKSRVFLEKRGDWAWSDFSALLSMESRRLYKPQNAAI
jgi:hypothetical protein